jgi:hypothetical protein
MFMKSEFSQLLKQVVRGRVRLAGRFQSCGAAPGWPASVSSPGHEGGCTADVQGKTSRSSISRFNQRRHVSAFAAIAVSGCLNPLRAIENVYHERRYSLRRLSYYQPLVTRLCRDISLELARQRACTKSKSHQPQVPAPEYPRRDMRSL